MLVAIAAPADDDDDEEEEAEPAVADAEDWEAPVIIEPPLPPPTLSMLVHNATTLLAFVQL